MSSMQCVVMTVNILAVSLASSSRITSAMVRVVRPGFVPFFDDPATMPLTAMGFFAGEYFCPLSLISTSSTYPHDTC